MWNTRKNLVIYIYIYTITNRTSFMVTRKNEVDRVKLSNLTMTHSYYVLPSVEDGESNSVRRLLLKHLLSTGILLQVFSDLFSRLTNWRCFCVIKNDNTKNQYLIFINYAINPSWIIFAFYEIFSDFLKI